MKKMNAKGFTLIELLAVITIMGILMIVAIPAVTRTIENSRKDTFIDTVKQYVNGTKNMWAADNLTCTVTEGSETNPYVSSAVPNGTYYVQVSTLASDSAPQLLEQGGKSPWGSRDMKGYIKVVVEEAGEEGKETRKVSYYPVISDGVHGVNMTTSGCADGAAVCAKGTLTESSNIKRSDLGMSGMSHLDMPTDVFTCSES